MESLHKIISALRAKICACNERRNENTLRFTMTNRMLLLLFPIFIVCMAELNQDKYLSKLVIFIADHPTIMLFNILIAGLIFLGALLLFRKGWLAMLLQSVLYMALSIQIQHERQPLDHDRYETVSQCQEFNVFCVH